MSFYGEMRDARRQDAAARREQDRKDQREQWDRKDQQREQRRARRQKTVRAVVGWLGANPVELLMSVVVVVPGVLAWTAMAAFGHEIYGLPGWAFPAFSEAASWAFAFAAQRAQRRNKPTWMLITGLWIFTAVQAVLNFLHGSPRGTGIGIVMAIVSVSGVVVHQLHMWSDRTRRTGADRRAARRAKVAGRRAHRMAMAATRQANGQVHFDGTVTLLVREGTVELTRNRVLPWRSRVAYTSVADEVEQWLSTVPETPINPGNTPANETGETASDLQRDRGQDTAEDTPVPDGEDTPPRGWSWDDLVEAFWVAAGTGRLNPASQRNVRTVLRCSRDRARALVELYRASGGEDGGPTTGVAA